MAGEMEMSVAAGVTWMRTHWRSRPQWADGTRRYAWHLTFEDCVELHRTVAVLQGAMRPASQLDMVPHDWLHLTLADIGSTADVSLGGDPGPAGLAACEPCLLPRGRGPGGRPHAPEEGRDGAVDGHPTPADAHGAASGDPRVRVGGHRPTAPDLCLRAGSGVRTAVPVPSVQVEEPVQQGPPQNLTAVGEAALRADVL